MGFRNGINVGILLIFVSGCAGSCEMASPGNATATNDAFQTRTASLTEAFRNPWKKPKPLSPWAWIGAVPTETTRAELIPPVIPGTGLAEVVTSLSDRGVALASGGRAEPSYLITAVDDLPVADYNRLLAAVTKAVEKKKKARISFASAQGEKAWQTNEELAPAQLMALSQATAPQNPLVRATEDGNVWVVIRQEGIRCKAMVRVERQRCLLHVAMSLAVCSGSQAVLPKEIRAACDGEALNCLSAADSLQALYANSGGKCPARGEGDVSFASVSEREDYLLPANYSRLQEKLNEAYAGSVGPTPVPALATLPGIAYPGPALLGDARALSAFLMQRQLYQVGEPERIGWIMFSGEALAHGHHIDVDIDLGHGPSRLRFELPNQS